MILRIDEQRTATRPRKTIVYRCDQCGITYKGKYKLAWLTNRTHHFCSKKCLYVANKPGGVAHEFLQEHIREGVKCLGVENISQLESVKQKRRLTFNERYGVDNASQVPEIRMKISATWLERYGTTNPFDVPEIAEKIHQTLMKNYGVDNPLRSPQIQEKTRRTNIERYGVPCALLTKFSRQRINTPESCKKRHETMKRNGTYGKSRIKNTFYEMLIKHIDPQEIERQKVVNGWSIDFYIKNIDVYIQLDGIYWHGLNRAINVIAEHKTPRDVVIHNTWMRDRRQDAWFIEHHINLIRITDYDFKRNPESVLTQILFYVTCPS